MWGLKHSFMEDSVKLQELYNLVNTIIRITKK
jgi:hypothetical protein